MHRFGIDTDCSVCMTKTRARGYRKCIHGHRFHKGCIEPWLRDNEGCPSCRTPMRNARERQMYEAESEEESESEEEDEEPYDANRTVYDFDSIQNQMGRMLEERIDEILENRGNQVVTFINQGNTYEVSVSDNRINEAHLNDEPIQINYRQYRGLLSTADFIY